MYIYGNRSVDIGNHRYTNEQNYILLKKSVIKAKPRNIFFAPPNPTIVPTALLK